MAFCKEIVVAFFMIPGHGPCSFVGLGATRFHCSGKRCKEGDHGVRCPTRYGKGIKWPNLMIKVGYSEPLSHLRIRAAWWLVNCIGLTRMVIIILKSNSSNALDIDVWELSTNPRPKRRSTPITIPIVTNKIQIDDAGNVNLANASLTIPYTFLFENPYPFTTDIVLSDTPISGWLIIFPPKLNRRTV